MKKIKKGKSLLWDSVKWEDVTIEEDNQDREFKKEWEYVNWDRDIEIIGYYIGVRKLKDKKLIGLVMKQLPVEENEPVCYGFSLPVDLMRRLTQVENQGRLLHGIRIRLVDIISIGNGKKLYKFDVKTTPEVKIDEDVIVQYLSFTPEKLTGGNVI